MLLQGLSLTRGKIKAQPRGLIEAIQALCYHGLFPRLSGHEALKADIFTGFEGECTASASHSHGSDKAASLIAMHHKGL